MIRRIVNIGKIPIGIIQFDQNRELNAMGEIVSTSSAKQIEKDTKILIESLYDYIDKKLSEKK